MNYRIVESCDRSKFIQEVQILLNNGWELVGGASISVNGTDAKRYYIQSLVKR